MIRSTIETAPVKEVTRTLGDGGVTSKIQMECDASLNTEL
jgi:hypothetical protein